MKIIFFFTVVNIIISLNNIFCSKYPINEGIELTERSEEKLMYIQSAEEYTNYIKNYEYVISLSHIDSCHHCIKFLPIFKKASSYNVVNSKWTFLDINCSKNKDLCEYLQYDKFPYISIYIKETQINLEPDRELVPLLEFLVKLSSDPLIRTNSKEEFAKDYGTFSPIVEISNEDNNEFLECINNLANKDFLSTFYFGIIETGDDNHQKISFDNENDPISFEWDGICDNVHNFIFNNKYPLLTKIDGPFLKEISNDPRTVIMLITFPKNQKINSYLNNNFKNISRLYRHYVFGYVDYNEDEEISSYLDITINNKTDNEIKIVIYDFNKELYYIHPLVYDINKDNEDFITIDIKTLINNITDLEYTSGSKIKDFFHRIGLYDLTPNQQIIAMIVFILVLFGILILLASCTNIDEMDSGFESYESDASDNEDENEKSQLLKKTKKKVVDPNKPKIN